MKRNTSKQKRIEEGFGMFSYMGSGGPEPWGVLQGSGGFGPWGVLPYAVLE